MKFQKHQSSRRFSMTCERALTITFITLFLSGLGVLPVITGEANAQDFENTPTFIHDVQIPLPELVGPDVYWPAPGLPTSPPDNPEVGDSWIWWLWIHYPMPPHFEERMCTVRGKTDRGYVIVEDSEWLVTIDQNDVDAILEHWENTSPGPYPDQGIYEIDSLAFGEPPDELDEDLRIYSLWFDFEIAADGFFFWFDMYLDGTFPQYHSNECEVLYLSTTSSGGGPGSDYMHSVLSHEFQHMIHWKYDDNEDTWVNEGLSELAMWLFGHPDFISGFNGNPDNNLIIWNASWADYIKTYLWTLYFFEHYGGHPSIYELVHEPANSISGYEEVLDYFGYTENFADVFADWTVANFLDDTTIEDGRFGYEGEDLPPFNVSGTYSTYPVTDIYKTVNHWAADYYRFQDFTEFESLQLSFDGSDGNSFAVWGLALYGSGDTEVHRMTVEETTQTGTLDIGGLSDPYDEVILVVASASSAGGMGYYFSANASEGIEHEVVISPHALLLQVMPNPFTTTVTLQLNWNGDFSAANSDIEIFDAQGRIVHHLSIEEIGENEATLVWNGNLDDGHPASPGVYFARAQIGSLQRVQKILYLP